MIIGSSLLFELQIEHQMKSELTVQLVVHSDRCLSPASLSWPFNVCHQCPTIPWHLKKIQANSFVAHSSGNVLTKQQCISSIIWIYETNKVPILRFCIYPIRNMPMNHWALSPGDQMHYLLYSTERPGKADIDPLEIADTWQYFVWYGTHCSQNSDHHCCRLLLLYSKNSELCPELSDQRRSVLQVRTQQTG